MRLADLNPKLDENNVLTFDCPAGHPHRVVVLIGGNGWEATGDYPDTLTLRPSILPRTGIPFDVDGPRDCGWHGFITDGGIVHA